jgi:two-component system sporulation sensor kinase A
VSALERSSILSFDSWFRHHPDAVVVTDLEGVCLYRNAAFRRLTNGAEDRPAASLYDMIGRATAPAVRARLESAAEGGSGRIEGELYARAEGFFDVELTCVPVGNDTASVDAVYWIARPAAQEEKRSRELFRLINAYTNDIVSYIAHGGNLAYVNQAVRKALGYEPDWLVGTKFTELLHPDDYAHLLRKNREKESDLFVYRFRHRLGHYVWLETIIHRIRDESGNHLYSVNISRDVTERKRTEEALLRSEKLAVAGELAAGIGHEIRNPLTTLKGFLQLLPRQREKLEDFLDVMRQELDRIDSICSELLLLAKPQAVTYRDEDVNALVAEVTSLLRPQAGLCNVTIGTRLEDCPSIVRCDKNQVKQVFINLLKNAIESMPDGGTADVLVRNEGGDAIVRIEDRGVGIPEERLKKIGEPFYSTKDKGTGLGMLVSYKIVEAHRGRIRIDSSVNAGTKVEVTFPLSVQPTRTSDR